LIAFFMPLIYPERRAVFKRKSRGPERSGMRLDGGSRANLYSVKVAMMKAPLRRILVGLAAVVLAVILGAVFALTVLRGRTPGLSGPRSVTSLEKIGLGGVEQWVLIRGHDRDSPVLLFLHGGPGMPAMFLAHAFQRRLEREFVVVHWDRRGAGKSFDAASDRTGLSVRRTLEDAYELTRILRTRFGQDRIYLVGHSWGSYLGLLAVREHPEYYLAFVGTGQMAGDRGQVEAERREFLVRAAAETGDPELRARLAAPLVEVTEDDLFRYGGELHAARNFLPILMTGLRAPEYTLRDIANVKKGSDLVGREMKYDVEPKPLEGEIPALEVPVFFLLGRHDFNTPSRLAAEYLNRLSAPLNGLVWFERSAHFPFFEEPKRFRAEMLRIDGQVREFWTGSDRDHFNQASRRAFWPGDGSVNGVMR
jgi:pimeloyl-ACP methyl ester carboxylesterase